jgi:hypothetical protein
MSRMKGLLSDAMSKVSGKAPQVPVAARDHLGSALPQRRKSPDRRAMTTWQKPEALKQLKALAFELDRSQQELVAEAFNELFAKYHKPRIA